MLSQSCYLGVTSPTIERRTIAISACNLRPQEVPHPLKGFDREVHSSRCYYHLYSIRTSSPFTLRLSYG